MTALLTADEAARLRPGEQLVIVRAGDETWKVVGGDRYDLTTASSRLEFVAAQDWVALTGSCPTCGTAEGWVHAQVGAIPHCPDCRDGRRIEPLYIECPTCGGRGYWSDDVKDGKRWLTTERTCLNCLGECSCSTAVHYPDNPDCLANQGHTGRVLVGRAAVVSIEPEDDGRNFRITLDVVEVA